MADSKDSGDSVDYSLANPDTLTKLKTAAEISQKVLAKVKEACTPSANLLEVCQKGDSLLEEETGKVYKGKKIAKGIAFPTSISPNNAVAHLSPLASEPEAAITLKAGDVVKISLGAHIDGFAGILADTLVIPEEGGDGTVTGRKADVLMAAWLASEAAIRLIKPGTKNYAVTDAVSKIAESFGCKPLEGMLSHQQARNDISGKKTIILNPTMEQKNGTETVTFAEGEVYSLDILVSTGTGHARRTNSRTTIFAKTESTYLLKLKSSRSVYSEIQKKFGVFPFSVRSLEDEKKSRMGLGECKDHGLLIGYEVLYEKDGEYVAQFQTTIALTKNGTVRLSGPAALDTEKVKSEKKLEDEELLKLIAEPLKAGKSKNKKKKKAGEEAKAEAEEESK